MKIGSPYFEFPHKIFAAWLGKTNYANLRMIYLMLPFAQNFPKSDEINNLMHFFCIAFSTPDHSLYDILTQLPYIFIT